MGISGVGPTKGPGPTGPEPKKTPISQELKSNVDHTKAVAMRATLDIGQAKIEGYTEGSANKAEDSKASNLFSSFFR